MPKYLIFVFSLLCLNSSAQTFNDYIITMANDSINCTITKLEKNWINYEYQGKRKIKNSFFSNEEVKRYSSKGIIVNPNAHKYPKSKYEEIVFVDSTTSKNELYSAFMDWFAKQYVAAQNVIQYQDKEEGKIVGKGTFYVASGLMDAGYVHHTISIISKRGKYKYIIDNIYFSSTKGSTTNYDVGIAQAPKWYPQSTWNDIREQSYLEIQKIILSMKNSANNIKKSDDW